MSLLLGVVQELDHTPFRPVVGNGPRLPVQDNGGISDGEEVGAGEVDCNCMAVLQHGYLEVV